MMNNKAFIFSLFVLLLTLGLTIWQGQRGKPAVLQTRLEALPKDLAGYQGSDSRFPDSVYRELNADYVVAHKDGVNNVLLHWYQSDGTKVLSNGFQQNIQRFVGRILHNRNDGAYVQVSAFTTGDDVASTRLRLKDFAREVLNLLPEYWPVEG